MRIVIDLPRGTTAAQAQQIAQALQIVSRLPARVEADGKLSDPALLRVQEGTTFYLLNPLEQAVCAVRGPLEGSLLATLVECRGVFRGSKVLHECLLVRFPGHWGGRGGLVRATYASLRKKLARTHYPLSSERGVYGFAANAQRPGAVNESSFAVVMRENHEVCENQTEPS